MLSIIPFIPGPPWAQGGDLVSTVRLTPAGIPGEDPVNHSPTGQGTEDWTEMEGEQGDAYLNMSCLTLCQLGDMG